MAYVTCLEDFMKEEVQNLDMWVTTSWHNLHRVQCGDLFIKLYHQYHRLTEAEYFYGPFDTYYITVYLLIWYRSLAPSLTVLDVINALFNNIWYVICSIFYVIESK